MILKRTMILGQQSPARPKWSGFARFAIFTAEIDDDDDSQPQSTTDREALWKWEFWTQNKKMIDGSSGPPKRSVSGGDTPDAFSNFVAW